MALQQQLDRFKKQQEKCQSTLSSIAASKVGNKKPNTPVAAVSTNGRNVTTGIKFSKDTERLQHINSIRKAPVGAQMKRVIDLLLEVIVVF
ncbi:general transcription factor IIE subunit 2-like [Trifolium medium]|uniref:General transcription factor IIE subunit 2-like n=1 Tax=Trifolium medium TaxID=97028 RepID=A0A392SBX1_9FABA|nr:general transcription factor IIE subunit 2-like [Trifolium medium]